MPSIKLQSSDGKTFPIDLKIAKLSVTIKTMLEDLGMDLENESNEAVPLTNVTAVVLEKVYSIYNTGPAEWVRQPRHASVIF